MATDRLAEIFKRQLEFVKSLEPIYRDNLMFPGYYPLRLDSRDDQEHFRLLAWRCMEELCEAVECYYEYLDTESYEGKFAEEMADALHFLIELCIATGVTEGELVSGYEATILNPEVDQLHYCFWRIGNATEATIPERIGNVGYKLGLAMHQLRQRPWRTDDRPTNRTIFVGRMSATWYTFVTACKRAKIGPADIYNAYFAKSCINKIRRDENMPKSECSVEGKEDDQDTP